MGGGVGYICMHVFEYMYRYICAHKLYKEYKKRWREGEQREREREREQKDKVLVISCAMTSAMSS